MQHEFTSICWKMFIYRRLVSCGKSILLRLLAGLIELDDGQLFFQETDDQTTFYILSGGKKQRTALVCSLAYMLEVVPLDEVIAALEGKNIKLFERKIHNLNQVGIQREMVF